jgi:hypothetical protein
LNVIEQQLDGFPMCDMYTSHSGSKHFRVSQNGNIQRFDSGMRRYLETFRSRDRKHNAANQRGLLR